MSEWTIGVIGGSGLYAVDGLENVQEIAVESPFGEPSAPLVMGEMAGHRFVFLPRHGKGHRLTPTEVNARANIDALKRAGCTDIVAISAIGSLQEELPPGQFVIVDQFIDRTRQRASTFFTSGMVAHVSMADPVCPRLSDMVAGASEEAGANVAKGGTYLAMEGPQFSSRAESHLYRSWGADVIGMTAMPEAKLAREAELPYALVGMVTDYDCWREHEAPVEVEAVIAQMNANATKARAMLQALAASLPDKRDASPIDTCLDYALITSPEARDPALLAKLDAVMGRIHKKG
ncbi:S-methyl-5'-thioadenosine phosphorylase [Alterisphingorhabdus coralli]|uniref:S-methyl-5'-thioadenosine phosphorylase n=1 Tax=Alterisphingorhabdus coralli TaxID=3071408 RepID=A0AA97F9L4_9SPHN|nr:S-methyl-5'-thioadenosine phosphorylase [Parasphingorhabdus sp. SCSIO 66989]WOE76056.1 S-methyl-5'-thioadenosine phosphorylase [Parasphingorhabdus sp. SCSIO 66989]